MRIQAGGMKPIVFAEAGGEKKKKTILMKKAGKEARGPGRSPSDELHVRIARRAYELYATRGCRQGSALDDWLEAEREILSQTPPV